MYERSNIESNLRINGFHIVDCGNFTCCFKGLVYLPGHVAGEASMRILAEKLTTQPLNHCAANLKGIFGLIIIDRLKDKAQIMVDQSGLYKMFYDNSIISDSFRQLVEWRGKSRCQVDDQRLIEYLAHGSVYGRHTFVEEIFKIESNEIIQLTRGSHGYWQTERHAKQRNEQSLDSFTQFDDYFSNLDVALSERKLSVDMTGGLDTRLNFAMLLGTKLEFELALSGRPDSIDLKIGQKVARTTGHVMFETAHEIGDIEDELLRCYDLGDWQTDPLKFHRLAQLDKDRLSRGIDLIAHGGGGELFKDFLWLQDFPFLGIKKPNYKRFYSLRVTPVSCRTALSERGLQLLNEVRERTIEAFNSTGGVDNVTGYLMAVINFRGVEFYGRTFSNHINLGLDVLAPLLDFDNVMSGVKLPVSARLMNAWHRRIIDGHAPHIAAIESTEGYAPTYGKRFLGQLPGYLAMQGRRVLRKTSEKLLGKSMFLEIGSVANDDKQMISKARQTELALNSVAVIRERGLFTEDTTIENLTDTHVGRAIAIGMFLDRFKALSDTNDRNVEINSVARL